MAVTRGCIGIVKVKDAATTGAAARIYRVRDWNQSETAERLDSSEIGDCTKQYTAGAVETTVAVNAWWDTTTGANQSDMTVANDVYVEIWPGGTGVGKTYYKTPTGGANITEATKTGSIDGIVETSWSMTVNGSMTAVTAT